MPSFLHLNSFYVYNLLLIFIFSIIVNDNQSLSFLYSGFYCIFSYLIIYLGIYYYNKFLYIIYFFYGLGLDILWLNEIGPHLLVFLLFLVFCKFIVKYLYNLSSFKIYIVLLILQLSMINFEILISYILFNFEYNLNYIFQLFITSLLLSVPIFIIFSKIDKIK